MKKLLILTMMCALFGSMVALESDPSEVVGYVKYECVTTGGTDLNLISLPLDAGFVMASDLGDAIGADVINAWDAPTQSWLSASNLGFMWAGDFPLNNGHSYMVNIITDTSVYIAGSLIVLPSYNLITTNGTDLNLLMVPLDRSDLTLASELGNDIGVCDVVNKWNAATQSWNSASDLGFMWAGDFSISIADPLLLNVTSNVTWPSTDSGTHRNFTDGRK